jgi:eukaryotic-like serine/threonine-protein kinase
MDQFDTTHWRKVNEALDQALELDGSDRDAFLKQLDEESAAIASEVNRLINRAEKQTAHTEFISQETLATALVRSDSRKETRQGLTTHLAPLLAQGGDSEHGFDHLLQRALRADRSTHKSARYRGEMCGPWRIKEVIGTGGMGEVWLAERADGLFQAQAAVKFLRPDGDISRFEARFSQERALLARLNHPGIARLLDAGRQFGRPFLVLEYVDGLPLLDYVEQYAPTVDARLALIRGIGDAIAHAHAQLVVHRDLKPSNVMVTPKGDVKLLDFGVAGLLADANHDETTESAVTKMSGRGLTLEYAAPEQITGDSSGVASDVYSLGSLAYHLLAGRRAYVPQQTGRAALEHAILHTEPLRVSEALKQPQPDATKDNIPPPTDVARVNADIDAIIARAMRRNPADRYATAAEFTADLRRFAERRPISTRREDRAYRLRLWLRRNWLPTALAATLAVALVGGFIVSLWQADRARTEAARATKTADYLVELLRNADPDLHGGEWPTALSLLEQARNDVSARFADDPATEARLSSLIADTFRSLSRDTEALPIAKRATELTRKIYGENSTEYAKIRATYATSLHWVDRNKDAVSEFEGALPVLRSTLAADDPVLGQAQLNYAAALSKLQRFDESEAIFRAHFETLSRSPAQNAWQLAVAEGDYARTLQSQGRWGDAYTLLLRNEARYNNPPAGAEKIALYNRLALVSTQTVIGRYEGAEERLTTLLSAWKRLAGSKSDQVFSVLNDLGYLYYRLGDGVKAENTYTELRNLKLQMPDLEPLRRLSTDVDLIEIRLMFGRQPLNELAAAALLLIEEVRAVDVTESDRAIWLITRLAMVLDACGESGQAKRTIELANQMGERLALPDGPWRRRIERAEASLERRWGDAAKAVPGLQAAVDRLSKTRTTGYSQRWIGVHLELALAHAERDIDAARKAVTVARSGIPSSLPPEHYVRAMTDYVSALVEARGHGNADTERARLRLEKSLGHPANFLSEPLPAFFMM